MTDDNQPDSNTQKSGAELSAEAGIGRGCPFCGRREKTIRDWHFLRITDTKTTQVECLSCGARGAEPGQRGCSKLFWLWILIAR